jgi:hypothetical protein
VTALHDVDAAEAVAPLARGEIGARELVAACLAATAPRDLPVAVKDIVDTADLPPSAASPPSARRPDRGSGNIAGFTIDAHAALAPLPGSSRPLSRPRRAPRRCSSAPAARCWS